MSQIDGEIIKFLASFGDGPFRWFEFQTEHEDSVGSHPNIASISDDCRGVFGRQIIKLKVKFTNSTIKPRRCRRLCPV